MPRYGFIHDMLDIKFLVLYIVSRAAAPLDLPTLTDLTMIDEGVDYFTFAQALAELVKSEHLTLENECYAITDKGRKNGAVCESSLPYSVKSKCSRRLAKVNAVLRRNSQVRSEVLPRADGTYTLRLTLDDETGNLLTLSLFSPSLEQAERLAEGYKLHPEQVYNGVLDVLLDQTEEKES
ncbi:MAG: DUF4364 family protein [Pseudoflavonifractor sp.]